MRALALLLPLVACATVPVRGPELAEQLDQVHAHAPLPLVELQRMATGGMPGAGLSSGSFSAVLLSPGATGADLTLTGLLSGASGSFSGVLSTRDVRPAAGTDNSNDFGTTTLRYRGLYLIGTEFLYTVTGTDAIALQVNGARIHFGAGASDYASSDGTTVTFAGPIASTTVTAGMGANTAVTTLEGTVNITTGDVTSAGASNLISYTLPANALNTTNRCLRITGWGTSLNNANAKTVALVFGGQTLITKQLTVSVAGVWKLTAHVCRSGSSTQDVLAEAWNNAGTTVAATDGATVLYQAARVAGTQTDTATIVIKGTTTVATTTDVTMDDLVVEYE